MCPFLIYFVPLDKLICKGEFPIQENLEVNHLLPEDVLTFQKVTCDLSLIEELNTGLETFRILRREEKQHTQTPGIYSVALFASKKTVINSQTAGKFVPAPACPRR